MGDPSLAAAAGQCLAVLELQIGGEMQLHQADQRNQSWMPSGRVFLPSSKQHSKALIRP